MLFEQVFVEFNKLADIPIELLSEEFLIADMVKIKGLYILPIILIMSIILKSRSFFVKLSFKPFKVLDEID